MPPDVLGEADEGKQVAAQLGVGHEGAPPVAAHEPSLLHELGQGLAHRDPADLEPLAELALGGQQGLGRPLPRVDHLLYGGAELEVEGHGAALVEGGPRPRFGSGQRGGGVAEPRGAPHRELPRLDRDRSQ